MKKVLEIAKEFSYDVIMPVGLESFLALSKYRSNLDSHTRKLLPPIESMEIASSKPETFRYARNLGIPVPVTCEFTKDNLLKLGSFLREAQFPVVVKGSLGGVDNLRYCNTFNQLRKAIFYLFNYEEKLICQEYVVGTGHGFYCNYKKGKLNHFFMHKRIKEFPVTGGSSAVARSYFDDKLMDKGKLLLDNLEWNGPAMVEFKFDLKTNDQFLTVTVFC